MTDYKVNQSSERDWVGNRIAVSTNATAPACYIFYSRVLTGGATSVVLATQAGVTANMGGVLVEYSGTNIIPDVWRVGNTGSSTTLTTATTDTTTAANSLVIGACAQRGTFSSEQTSWASSPTNSFSIVAQTLCFTNTSNADRAIAFLERIVTSASTYSTGVTSGTSTQFACNIATFREIKVTPVFG